MKPNDICDVQNKSDARNIAVNRVGVKELKHPIVFCDLASQGQSHEQNTIATFDMMVNLAKHLKGTHMSRFVEILNEQIVRLSVANLPQWLTLISQRLNAQEAYLKATFLFFVNKKAPVSGVNSLMDYHVCLEGQLINNYPQRFVTVTIPVTSLCPCSKEISDYGAHNQRSHVTVKVRAKATLHLAELIQLIESKASCELYGILKRNDEKYVTERAYNNPMFVEDMVREVASVLAQYPDIEGFNISSENFESIHNHSAYAQIDQLVPCPQKKESLKEQTLQELELA